MSLATISDIHIHQEGDRGHLALQAFAANPGVKAATHIGLLGDIFDLMAGDHPQYLVRYDKVFSQIASWCEEGKVVYFAEGNHDMHLAGLFRRLTREWTHAATTRLVLLKTDQIIKVDGQVIKLGHGDRYNREDTTYLKYMDFITAPVFNHAADHMMPYQVLKYLGEKASKKSRKYGTNKFDEEKVRQTFRRGVELLTPAGVDVVVGGHSHVTDEYQWNRTIYLNNGFPPATKKFVLVDCNGGRLADF